MRVLAGLVMALGLYAQNANTRAYERLAKEVRHELVMLPNLNVFDNLAFRVDGSTVTLLGHVTRPTLKSATTGIR